MTSFDRPQLAIRFAAAYPEQPVKLRHGLCGHPAADARMRWPRWPRRMRPERHRILSRRHAVRRRSPSPRRGNGLSIQETIRRIEECGSWMVLKFVEQDATLSAPCWTRRWRRWSRRCGRDRARCTSIAASSSSPRPDSVTPLHFDPEHNILLQIRGEKTMIDLPRRRRGAGARRRSMSAFHAGGHRNLPWRDEFADARQQAFDLAPGEARACAVQGAALGEERRRGLGLLLDHLALGMELSRGYARTA